MCVGHSSYFSKKKQLCSLQFYYSDKREMIYKITPMKMISTDSYHCLFQCSTNTGFANNI